MRALLLALLCVQAQAVPLFRGEGARLRLLETACHPAVAVHLKPPFAGLYRLAHLTVSGGEVYTLRGLDIVACWMRAGDTVFVVDVHGRVREFPVAGFRDDPGA